MPIWGRTFSTSPSLLQGELHFLPKPLFNSLYDPFGSPCRGQKPQKEGCNRPTVLTFLKSTRPSLPLKKAPPLISVFSPQGRRGKPPYSVLRTATLLGWRTIRGLCQVLRDGTAWRRFAIRTHFALITRLMRLPTKNVTMSTGVG